jgi:hypothetical protein
VLLGQFFLGLIAILLLIGDTTRDPAVRLGGGLLIAWWMSVWTLDSLPPWWGFGLLVATAVAFAVAAARQRAVPARAAASALLAATCLALAGLNLWPYGLRSRSVGRLDAERRAVAALHDGTARRLGARDFWRFGLTALDDSHGATAVAATAAQTVGSRFRFTQTPIWYVVLLEPNRTVPTTADGEPCFARSETVVVDALSGGVTRLGVRTALDKDNGCLRLKYGTRDVLHAPGS